MQINRPPEPRTLRGFTLLEVVVVLVLMGILAAVAIARVTDHGADERAAADKLRVHLRFAQMQALNSDRTWGIRATGGSYFLYSDGDSNDADNVHLLPGENSNTVIFPHGITQTFFLSFDQWGRPYTDENPETNTPASAIPSITIGTESITITPETGFML